MIQAIKDELAANPATYDSLTDKQVADLLNVKDKELVARFLSGSDIFNATDDIEYAALPETDKIKWDALCAINSIDTSSGIAKAREVELFGAGTATRTNLVNARKSLISRAQEIGIGHVREGHVIGARL